MLSALSFEQAYGQSQEQIKGLLQEGIQADSSEESTKKTKITKEKKVKAAKEAKVKVEQVTMLKEERAPKVKVAKAETKSLPAIVSQTYTGGAKSLMKNADQLFNEDRLYLANNYYSAALDKTKKKKLKGVLNYKLGFSMFQVRDYPMSEKYFEESLTYPAKKKKFNDAKFYLALDYKHQAKYEKAKESLKDFINETEGNINLDYQRTKARLELKGCEYALELIVENPAYLVTNPGDNVNGPFADFGPEIRRNELIYSKITGLKANPDDDTRAVSQLFSAELNKDQYSYAQNFSAILNDGNDYVCNPNFTLDGKVVYFTRCSLIKQKGNICTIFKSELVNGIWTSPVQLNSSINQENSSSSHPQLVEEDGKEILYFTSDRASGKGGKDIWYSTKNENGEFGPAKNMGSPVNTKYDDLSPFYHVATKTLYYSTDGKATLGGLDVFKSEKVVNGWLEPVNLETPVNSSLDDYDFILNANGTFGYLVSNREGTTTLKSATCCDDIFEVRTTQIKLSVKGLVYAENNDGRALIKEAVLSLKNLTEGIVEKIMYNGQSFTAPLNNECDYELVASNEDFEDLSVKFNTKNILKSDTLQYDLVFKERKSFNNQVIGIVYYEYNQAKLTAEAPKTLEQVITFLKEYPKAQVEVSAHTDGNGADKYNLELSKGRCEAAVSYLTFNGIAKDRIVKNWFGESNPVAPEVNQDGSDNPNGRALNRRTEFKIKASN